MRTVQGDPESAGISWTATLNRYLYIYFFFITKGHLENFSAWNNYFYMVEFIFLICLCESIPYLKCQRGKLDGVYEVYKKLTKFTAIINIFHKS